jgi:hypothetical protein
MTTRSFEDNDNKELFKLLEDIKVTFADGTQSTTMDMEMRKALSESIINSNTSTSKSNRKGKGKGKNKTLSNL